MVSGCFQGAGIEITLSRGTGTSGGPGETEKGVRRRPDYSLSHYVYIFNNGQLICGYTPRCSCWQGRKMTKDFLGGRIRRRVITGMAALGLLAGGLAGLDALWPLPLERARDLSVTVVDREGVPLRRFLSHDQAWRLPATVESVAPVYLALLLANEDQRFRAHWGIDPLAVVRAAGQNLGRGRVVSGASTLTMQVARRLVPRPRTLGAKLIESARALQLEAHYDKDAILGLYLTLAPFGSNLEGIESGARAWFGKSPATLTTGEAALLVALPQAPSQLRPDRFPARARAARARVLARGLAAGVLSPAQVAEAEEEPIPSRRLPPPFHAPHLAQHLRAASPGTLTLTSTLNGALQRTLEDLARQETRNLSPEAGLALLVVDNRSREVLAAIGAPDYFDERRNGPVDLTRAVRSPGSALKPFIYGLGFDDHVIHPETLVADVSVRFGGYAPANFDRDFHGELTIREALQRSLNVPAVIVLERVGPVRFADALARAGARLVLPPATPRPGLPIALGGASISLADLTMLYVGLANGGLVAPLVVARESLLQSTPEPVRLLSAEAAAQVLAILQGTPPPPGVVQIGAIRQGPPLATKTGTSYGFRDAWCLGVSPRYTVGVWVGRPDGTPSPDRYGRNTAAPILFRVFDRLPPEPATETPPPAAHQRPPELLRRLEPGDPATRPLSLPDPDRLRLVFPTPGIVIDRSPGTGQQPEPLTLTAVGGRRPLTWIINGQPLPASPLKREAQWQPDGLGAARVTVLDADGRSASAEFELK